MSFLSSLKHQPAASRESLWMLTFTDLLSLLLAFFVLKISMSTFPEASPRVVLVSESDIPESSLASLTSDVAAATAERDKLAPASDAFIKELALPANDEFGAALTETAFYDNPSIAVYGSEKETLVLFSKETFLPGSATLSFSAASALSALSKIAAESGQKVRVLGFSDSSAINTAEFPSNWELSAARSLAAVRQMIDAGVEPTTISVAGYGSSNSKMSEKYKKDDAVNRRLEVYLEPISPS